LILTNTPDQGGKALQLNNLTREVKALQLNNLTREAKPC
jgi:hypothetical protein